MALLPISLQCARRPRPRLRFFPRARGPRLHRITAQLAQLFTHELGVELVLVPSISSGPFPTSSLHVVHLPLGVGERAREDRRRDTPGGRGRARAPREAACGGAQGRGCAERAPRDRCLVIYHRRHCLRRRRAGRTPPAVGVSTTRSVPALPQSVKNPKKLGKLESLFYTGDTNQEIRAIDGHR